jgi:hypothetical protein
MTAAGYRWNSALFDTTRFKKLVIPQNKKELRTNAATIAEATGVTQQPIISGSDQSNFVLSQPVCFQTFTGSAFAMDVHFLANPPGFNSRLVYTDSMVVTLKIEYAISGVYQSQFPVRINFQNFTTGVMPGSEVILPITEVFGDPKPPVPFAVSGSYNISFQTGDAYFWWFELTETPGSADFFYSVTLNNASFKVTSPTSIPVPINPGDLYSINDTIPQNIRQIDFLVGIVKLFNLYVYEDKFDEKLIYITPYIDFYSKNLSNAVDWTHKLNHNKPIKSRPMSELNAKIYKFKFKSDSDYHNDLYRKRYNEGYGDRIYDSEFEFSTQAQEFEIVFSGTPLIGYAGEDKVYPTIFKRTGSDLSSTEENTDSNIRILQTKKITGVLPWNIKNESLDDSPVINTLTRYGYAGHLDDPDVPTNDLNFGAPRELFFILTAGSLSQNQFNVYWSGYMREITDKDSKLVTGNFYLTTKDILDLDFSKYVYVDGIAFRLNAINDYDVTSPNDCVVELLKVNAASYTESSSNDGPPAGCYLLWSDENTLDWDDSEPLLYGDCNTNPGDGGEDSDPPVVYNLTWSFVKNIPFGVMRIHVNGELFSYSTTNGGGGTFPVTAGMSVQVTVSGQVNKPKRIFVSNDVDGVINDSTSTVVTYAYTFTIDANKNYNVVGVINP